MKHITTCLTALGLTLPLAGAMAQPVVKDSTASIYASVADPDRMSFAADGTLYVGRDASGSGGSGAAAVKIHRVAPGGSPVTEYGAAAISDPDALIVDVTGAVSGTPGSVLVGGVHNDGSTGKITQIAPDGTVTTLFGPSAALWNPTDFTFDLTGRLLITEYNNGKVLVSSGGMPTVLFSLSQAACIAVDSLNRIAVSTVNSTQLRLYTSDGTLLNASFAAVKAGSPVARGPGGSWGADLYAVAPNGDLIRIAADGKTTVAGHRFVMSSGATFPALAFGPDGALYASDFQADCVYRFGQPVVPGTQAAIYARVTDPDQLSFAPDGTLFTGRDNAGSGGGNSDAVKIHRIGPGGSPVEEYGNTAITDPDGVFYDTTGQFSGTPGAVIVGGEQLNSAVGKLVKILPDGSATTIYGPTDFGFNPNAFVLDEIGGRLLFSDSEGGRIWTMTNATPAVLFSLSMAFPLAVDSLGRIIAGANDSTLRLYGASGTLLNGSYAPAQPNTSIARGPGGFWGEDLYFIGTNWNLMRLATNGVVSQVGTSFGGLNCFTFGPDGALYASQFHNDLIWRIAPGMPPVFVGTNTASGQVRVAFSYQITGSNNPTGFGAAGLPVGLTIDSASGLISGVPLASGDFNVTLSATNAFASASTNLLLQIAPPIPLQGSTVLQPSGGANDGSDDGSAGKGKDRSQWADAGGSSAVLYLLNSPCNVGHQPAYLQFAVPPQPTQDITRVEVQVYCKMFFNGAGWAWTAAPYQISLRRVTASWNELTLPASVAPTPLASRIVTAVGGATAGFVEFEGWLTFDITPLYREWASGSTANYGLQIAIDTAYCANGNEFWVYSSDNATASLRPKLVVETALQPKLTILTDASNATLGWKTLSNAIYQVQFSESLNSWTNQGDPFLGRGGETNLVMPVSSPTRFFRVEAR